MDYITQRQDLRTKILQRSLSIFALWIQYIDAWLQKSRENRYFNSLATLEAYLNTQAWTKKLGLQAYAITSIQKYFLQSSIYIRAPILLHPQNCRAISSLGLASRNKLQTMPRKNSTVLNVRPPDLFHFSALRLLRQDHILHCASSVNTLYPSILSTATVTFTGATLWNSLERDEWKRRLKW